MKRILLLTLGISMLAVPTQAAVTGQWDFNSGDLRATIGTDLAYFGDVGPLTTFSNMTINGSAAGIMAFPAATPSQGYIMTHGIAPNGGGSFVNQFTLVMDIMYPPESSGFFRSLLQTSSANSNDGDLFVNGANGIGISGSYQGVLDPGIFHRVALVFDLALPTERVRKYIDGVYVG